MKSLSRLRRPNRNLNLMKTGHLRPVKTGQIKSGLTRKGADEATREIKRLRRENERIRQQLKQVILAA